MDRYSLVSVVIALMSAGCHPQPENSFSGEDAVQAIVTRSYEVSEVDVLLGQIPYESITFERGQCFGNCPVYKVTFNRDGSAELITEHLSLRRAEHFTGVIPVREYARLAQLIDIARSRTDKAAYTGGWTDDYTAVVSARGSMGDWSVSDYGQVAPAEIWVLEQILHKVRMDTNWDPESE